MTNVICLEEVSMPACGAVARRRIISYWPEALIALTILGLLYLWLSR